MKIHELHQLLSVATQSAINDKLPTNIYTSHFSKMLERITYKIIFKNLTKNNLFYCKQFGFQKGYSPEHAVLQVVEQINQYFEKNEFTLVVFVDLFKAFDTVDHNILLRKIRYYWESSKMV